MITILGSTGTIGINTLSIISKIKTKNSIFALTANRNTKLLFNQIKKYKPAFAVIGSKDDANILSELCSKNKIKTKILKPKSGEKLQHILLAEKNAIESIKLKKTSLEAHHSALSSLSRLVNTNNEIKQIKFSII